jgi:hypothetical protein
MALGLPIDTLTADASNPVSIGGIISYMYFTDSSQNSIERESTSKEAVHYYVPSLPNLEAPSCGARVISPRYIGGC